MRLVRGLSATLLVVHRQISVTSMVSMCFIVCVSCVEIFVYKLTHLLRNINIVPPLVIATPFTDCASRLHLKHWASLVVQFAHCTCYKLVK